jgi:plasmid maintenance system antidote protein VapI
VKRRYDSLNEFLEATGKTQGWLASELRISRSYVSLLVSGQRQPALSLALEIATLTGVALESLVSEEARA